MLRLFCFTCLLVTGRLMCTSLLCRCSVALHTNRALQHRYHSLRTYTKEAPFLSRRPRNTEASVLSTRRHLKTNSCSRVRLRRTCRIPLPMTLEVRCPRLDIQSHQVMSFPSVMSTAFGRSGIAFCILHICCHTASLPTRSV